MTTRALAVWMAAAMRDASLDAMLRAQTLEELHRAAWKYAVGTALFCQLNDTSGAHPAYIPKNVDAYSRHSAGRVRLAREYVKHLGEAADDAARTAIAQGVFA